MREAADPPRGAAFRFDVRKARVASLSLCAARGVARSDLQLWKKRGPLGDLTSGSGGGRMRPLERR
jgi:hypothetical protein